MSRFLKQLFFRYRVLHLLVLLFFSLLLQFLYLDRDMPFLPQWMATLIVVALCVLAASVAANRLVPRLLYRKRKAAFVLYTLGIAVINSILIYLAAGSFYAAVTGIYMFPSLLYFVYMCSFFFAANVIVIAIACALRILADRFGIEDRLAQIEQDKLSTELAFLRAQINPHFLFNVLNTIYFQIDRSNAAARDSVEKFSEILRYQLYECSTEKVGIEREIANIRSYVSIQHLRLEKGIGVSLTVSPQLPHFTIAPLLILPLVENAFKHISHFKNPVENKVNIALYSPQQGIFVVEIENTFNEHEATPQLVAPGGLGLQNVQRRLALLYPQKHQLDTHSEGCLFKIKLQIVYDDSLPAGGR